MHSNLILLCFNIGLGTIWVCQFNLREKEANSVAFQMDNLAMKIDIGKCISYGDVIVEVLKNKKDISNLRQSLEGANMLQSSCETDLSEVQNSLEEYQKKINACKQKINEAKSGSVVDTDIESLENELEEELQREHLLKEELRIISDEINGLEHQRVSIEERKKSVNKSKKDELRTQSMLSMYASVTNIIPNLGDQNEISGHIVERDKKMVEKFEFETVNASPSEICNKLWKMIDL